MASTSASSVRLDIMSDAGNDHVPSTPAPESPVESSSHSSPSETSERSVTPSSSLTSVSDTDSVNNLEKPSLSIAHDAMSKGPNSILKKVKPAPRTSSATGISTTVPVTGERPKPGAHPTLDDDVLFAIFMILYSHDPKAKGMTVKQICDILIEKHPKMATLSSKTSNLVSAKLNAYVKRVEKGERSIIYALSRDWADASPKRMVYVYRGLLTDDYYLHVKSMLESQKAMEASNGPLSGNSSMMDDDSVSADAQGKYKKKNGIPTFDMGSRSPFLESPLDLRLPQLSIPYSVAPVTASLNDENRSPFKPGRKGDSNASDYEYDEFDTFRDDDDDEDDELETEIMYRRSSLVQRGGAIPPTTLSTKRSKSLSSLSKRPRHITAAAAAPRIPRVSVSTPGAAAAVAALRAATLQAMSPSESFGESTFLTDPSVEPSASVKWLETLRSGFLTQEFTAPEDLSLAELDALFA
ncbi:unnamed protein product [Kuraishia capsulata CBS 1993]|uniref:GDS1 winged helix domain-containing protein n=1 Tax=Kuraishia capsulata CBS 1993 TaxID=1382522 RepID=W6MKG4_9ASCO|nr:uncharacterized protein KUCA_T00002830001 [Kuraishia capsulata CBS 1993]CDK26856.1 unnamed protein product [Kuraishia capsulata CBS 1993]